MSNARMSWGTAGLVAGFAGLAVSHGTAHYLGRRLTPFDAVAELVIDVTPGSVAHWFIELVGTLDKPLLGLIIAAIMCLLFLAAGRLAARAWWAPLPLYAAMGGFALLATLTRDDATRTDAVPVALGAVCWIAALSFITEPVTTGSRAAAVSAATSDVAGDAHAHSRRTVLIRSAVVTAIGVGTAVLGPIVGRGRRRVEQARRLLVLPATTPNVPAGVSLKGEGLTPWMTSADDFYLIDTAFQKPAIDPKTWSLRIHGMVEREVVLSYQELLDREVTEDWITLSCVSNPVGGDLIGNAWWSGVRIAPLLAEAGVRPHADAVLQTSQDGWTCGTPLQALTDDRQAMIAFAMNGEALPIEHGFPARVIVPGLYGYVSACKWVVDIEVTRFDRISAYWTELGWSEKAPLKIGSRIDVPRSGQDIRPGDLRIGGMAWAQHTGIERVEYAIDGGAWQVAAIGGITNHTVPAGPATSAAPTGEASSAAPSAAPVGKVPNRDTWVQWAATVTVDEGDHELRVRAVGADGEVQTGVEKDVRPDGATGWHTRQFSVG
ncbi:molybdopterin-dependent oxidoreductase [Nocardioides cavernaquae]|uniref:Oxidoreductase n=1 Tax=Nocardioides cavernaquae TaxID=2321396 RepID=A0A3A5HE84_9ACTN|nr:molybdopterin-dependent oxidoreductase [Nocardioides cavernaquae]RJS46300.1 oxidoreductase [Nocardioides cavernaquae]